MLIVVRAHTRPSSSDNLPSLSGMIPFVSPDCLEPTRPKSACAPALRTTPDGS